MERLKDDMSNAENETLGTWSELSVGELQELLFEVLDRMNLYVVRTNCTKHGNVELHLKNKDM